MVDLSQDSHLEGLPQPVIGVDEVGRGCLAGPVCAGAVILSRTPVVKYRDSKSLTAQQRKLYSEQITKDNQTAIGFASVEEIDEMNILQASLLAMRRAVLDLKIKKGSVIVDGIHLISNINNFTQIPVIKGDSKISCVAAASIIAKHYRDEWLKKLAEKYPGYGLEKHKGYGSVVHKKAIETLGPSPIHRKSFSGVREFIK